MKTAFDVLAALQAAGVEVVADGALLRFRPGELVTPDLREAMLLHKADLLRLVAQPQAQEGEQGHPFVAPQHREIAVAVEAWLRLTRSVRETTAIWPES